MPAVVASWVDGGLHLWGWDGAHTALPTGLRRAFDTPAWRVDPFQVGHLSTVEVQLPDGDLIRPATIRMPGGHGARWLGALSERERAESDSLAWLGAVADLAAATVAAGLVTPRVGEERDMLVARWVPVPDDTVDTALAALDAVRPPICFPAGGTAIVADVHAAMVDAVARSRLTAHDWRPPLPSRRDPALSAARSVLRALADPDPAIGGGGLAHPDELAALAARLERHERRQRGEPVVVPRVRLVVPDDPYDDWEVRLELVDEHRSRSLVHGRGRVGCLAVAVEVAGGRRSPDAPGRGRQRPGAHARRLCRDRRRAGHGPRTGHPRARRRGGRAVPRAGAGRAGRAAASSSSARSGWCGPASACAAAPPPPPAATTASGSGARRSCGGASSSPTTTGRRRCRTPSSSGPPGPAPRSCTAAGAGCASTPPRCAGPGAGWRTTSATSPRSMR